MIYTKLLILSIVVFINTNVHANSTQAFQNECRGYAIEEEIPKGEIDAYIKDCIAELEALEAENKNLQQSERVIQEVIN